MYFSSHIFRERSINYAPFYVLNSNLADFLIDLADHVD